MGAKNGKDADAAQEIFGVFIKRREGFIEEGDVTLDFEHIPGKQPRKINYDDFHILGTIGRGRYGVVNLVQKKDRSLSDLYAMKILHKKDIVACNEVQHTMTERLILGRHSHPFLVKLRWAFQTQDNLCFVMDFVSGGDLWSHLQHGHFTEERARFYAAEIILGLGYLHQLGIVYRDLKPENILLDAEGHVVLTDFGLAKVLNDGSTSTFCGTPEYIAPEVLQSRSYGKEVDWWALGTLIFEMIVGLPPFYSDNFEHMYADIVSKPLHIPRMSMSYEAADLVNRLLAKDPSHRLSDREQVQAHSFFASVDWDAVYEKRVPPVYRPADADFSSVLQDDPQLLPAHAVSFPGPSRFRCGIAHRTSDPELFDGFSYVEEGTLCAYPRVCDDDVTCYSHQAPDGASSP